MKTPMITAHNKIVIPASVRKKIGITKGMKVTFIERNGKLVIHPLHKIYFESVAGILGTKGKLLTSLIKDKLKAREL